MKFLLKFVVVSVVTVILAIFTFAVALELYGSWREEWGGYGFSGGVSDGVCNIAVVPVVGEIISYDGGALSDADLEAEYQVSADRVTARLREAEADAGILGVLMRIDSPGGGPVASELIMSELIGLGIPSAALIRGVGTSGGYLVATGADTIIASKFSDVGGIGINASYIDNSQQNFQQGLEYVQLTSAEYKDYWSPDRPLTQAERDLIQRDLDILHDVFVDEVALNRGMTVEQVQSYADGSTMPGELALGAGLIDSLGDKETARFWFAKQLEMPVEEVVFCE